MNIQGNEQQLSLFHAAMADWRPGETIYCLQSSDETGRVISVFDSANARDSAGGHLSAEVWFDLDVPGGSTPERRAQLADQCALTRAYLRYGKCRVVFRNAASIEALKRPGFKFAPGDVVLWTNDQGVKIHARRIVELEMNERGPTYYVTPNDAPWCPVREDSLQYAWQTYDELIELLPYDGGLLRRLEKEPRYLERASEDISSHLAGQGLDALRSSLR